MPIYQNAVANATADIVNIPIRMYIPNTCNGFKFSCYRLFETNMGRVSMSINKLVPDNLNKMWFLPLFHKKYYKQ
jgi:hypothetical protein